MNNVEHPRHLSASGDEIKADAPACATADRQLDLRGVLCPINFVKTKLKFEEMEIGEILEVILDDGEPMRNVPRSVKEEGHKIIKVTKLQDGKYYKLLITKR